MNILLKENSHEKINKPEEIEIPKEATSQNLLNDVITGRNDPLYKIPLSVGSWISTRRQPKEGHVF